MSNFGEGSPDRAEKKPVRGLETENKSNKDSVADHQHSLNNENTVSPFKWMSELVNAGNNQIKQAAEQFSNRINESAKGLIKDMPLILDAVILVAAAKEKHLPFEPLVPNAKTVAAMKAARRGELIDAGKVDNLFKKLNAKD